MNASICSYNSWFVLDRAEPFVALFFNAEQIISMNDYSATAEPVAGKGGWHPFEPQTRHGRDVALERCHTRHIEPPVGDQVELVCRGGGNNEVVK